MQLMASVIWLYVMWITSRVNNHVGNVLWPLYDIWKIYHLYYCDLTMSLIYVGCLLLSLILCSFWSNQVDPRIWGYHATQLVSSWHCMIIYIKSVRSATARGCPPDQWPGQSRASTTSATSLSLCRPRVPDPYLALPPSNLKIISP